MLDMCNPQSKTPCADCGKPAKHECGGCGEFFCPDSMSQTRKGMCNDCSFHQAHVDRVESRH